MKISDCFDGQHILKEKLSRWYHLPVEVIVENKNEKKMTMYFENYSETDVVNFFEKYIVSTVEDAFYGVEVQGNIQRELKKVFFSEIFYFEAIQDKLFVYTKDSAFQLKSRLYEIEELHPSFVRINKSIVVNILNVKKVISLLNSKLRIELVDGQDLEVNRKYKKTFMEYLEE